jgi:hypothetical protein
MTSLRIPRPLALDTAILGVWARGWAGGESKAQRLVEIVAQSDARVLVTLHHAIELAGHESDGIVDIRARFIGKLGQLFWIRSLAREAMGSILDIHAAEIRARVVSGDTSHSEIVQRARPEILEFGDSDQLAELLRDEKFRAYARQRTRRRRVVASIGRTTVSVPAITRQRVDAERARAPFSTVMRNLDREQRHLASQLMVTGDPRLDGQDLVAMEFFDELRRAAAEAQSAGTVTLAETLRRLGVADADLALPVTADELGDKYVWKRRSEILARIAGVPVGTVEALHASEIPSLHLREALAARHQRSDRADGGDTDDASLVCLSLYASVTSVDKRTAEYVRQVRQHSPELRSVVGRVVRLPTLQALEESISVLAAGAAQ